MTPLALWGAWGVAVLALLLVWVILTRLVDALLRWADQRRLARERRRRVKRLLVALVAERRKLNAIMGGKRHV